MEARKLASRLWLLVACLALAGMVAFAGPASAAGGKANATEKEKTAQKDKTSKVGEITVEATKIGSEVNQLTEAATIIPEQDISLGGYTDFTNVLRYTPGIQFKRAGGPGQYVYTKMRGFGDGHFVVLIDGVKVNEGMNAGTGNLFSKLDPYLIEKVEILRGPQAVLYGSDTTAGVISITTKGGLPGTNFNLGGEYGTYSWKKGYTGVRGTVDNFRYAVNMAYVKSDGVHEYEDFTNVTPQVKLGYSAGNRFDADLTYTHIKSKWNYAYLIENWNYVNSRDEWYGFQVPDPERWNKEDYDLAALKLKHQISDELRHKLLLGWYKKKTESNNPNNGLLGWITSPQDNFTLDWVHYYNKGEAVPVYDNGDGKPYWFENENLQADYNLIWDHNLDPGLNTLLLGLGYISQTGKKWGKYGQADGRLEAKSAYLNDQLLLLDEALVLNAGVRYDKHKDFGQQTTWKAGAAYTIKDTDSTLYANYGTSFRAPTVFNLYDPKYGNQDLGPEKGWTVQGGLRQSFLNDKLHFDLGAWHTKLKDVIVFKYTGVRQGTYINQDQQTTQGVEFAFSWDFMPNFTLLGNYTYTDSESEKDGKTFRTVQIARNTANLGLQYHQGDKLFLGVNVYYSGPRLRWRGDIEMKEYFRVDVCGRYKFWDGLSVFARVNNVLDETIEEGLGYEQPGIYAVAGLEWDFNLPKALQ